MSQAAAAPPPPAAVACRRGCPSTHRRHHAECGQGGVAQPVHAPGRLRGAVRASALARAPPPGSQAGRAAERKEGGEQPPVPHCRGREWHACAGNGRRGDSGHCLDLAAARFVHSGETWLAQRAATGRRPRPPGPTCVEHKHPPALLHHLPHTDEQRPAQHGQSVGQQQVWGACSARAQRMMRRAAAAGIGCRPKPPLRAQRAPRPAPLTYAAGNDVVRSQPTILAVAAGQEAAATTRSARQAAALGSQGHGGRRVAGGRRHAPNVSAAHARQIARPTACF